MNENLKKTIMDYAGYIAIALVSALYVLSALFVPGVTGKTLGAILVDGFLSYLLGICFNYLFSAQGVMNGEGSEKMLATRRLHGEAVERIAPFIERLDGWCDLRNTEALRAARVRILSAVGLAYVDCFDDDGRANGFVIEIQGTKEEKRALRRRRRALRRAEELNPARLSTSVLTGESSKNQDDPFDFGISTDTYLQRVNLKGAVTKLLTAVILGYYSVEPLLNAGYIDLLWRGVYVAMMLALGVVTMYRAKLFVTSTHRASIVAKINHLQAFENWVKKEGENHGKRLGCIQERAAEAAGSAEGAGTGECLHQPSEAAEIS
ncbi:MAG: hypothetical protein J6B09_06545 [Clostridia bacterium]|nr:hypothetical protein [Clostridia bacterium]